MAAVVVALPRASISRHKSIGIAVAAIYLAYRRFVDWSPQMAVTRRSNESFIRNRENSRSCLVSNFLELFPALVRRGELSLEFFQSRLPYGDFRGRPLIEIGTRHCLVQFSDFRIERFDR